MIIWPLAWFAGLLLFLRINLRRRMRALVCEKCGRSKPAHWDEGACYSYAKGGFNFTRVYAGHIQRGAYRERRGSDVLWSMLLTCIWPIQLAYTILRFMAVNAARGITKAVIAVTPLTLAELERRERERDKAIKEAQKSIDDQA